jgi:hypothetical protein
MTFKLPGKTKYAGRRRPMTRESGFHSHKDSTGGEYKQLNIPYIHLNRNESLTLKFSIKPNKKGQFVGFGGWLLVPNETEITVIQKPYNHPMTEAIASPPNWGKIGSMWRSEGYQEEIIVQIEAHENCNIALYEMKCGIVEHDYMDKAREVLLKNMYEFSPEGNFYKKLGYTTTLLDGNPPKEEKESADLFLKSCNRCARFLPININNERIHLSFTNHCVAVHRRPCSHTGFGKLRNTANGEILQLDYGYQLECRFCKKFEVNAAHNPQRTSAQMKEDGARRRALELLLTELYGGSPQLRYRHIMKSELTDDIWKKFGGKCFKCGEKLESSKHMHLDHTRPLALLYPLDGTATSLCKVCNSQKNDRPPIEYYSEDELKELSSITGIPMQELHDPSPNMEAIGLLKERLKWFFEEFLDKEELKVERDGKVAVELLIKALQKTLNKCKGGPPINLYKEAKKYFG